MDEKSVGQIICHEVVSSLQNDVKDGASSVDSSSSDSVSSGFLLMLRLLNNTSILGRMILDILREGSLDEQPVYVAVELYIKAHDCFSISSDIEGISLVLRNVKLLIMQQLARRNDYHLMIRLLTGIGRYSEMTYIFELLKDHHKFELLLGKSIERVPQLRVALVDSLKGDKDMYPMVALNFSMHREIAEMLEADAKKILKNIHVRRDLNIQSIKDLMERSLADLVDASESYAKASCYNQSKRCGRLAELLALQIFHLSSSGSLSVMLLNLSPSAVADFVSHHNNFHEVTFHHVMSQLTTHYIFITGHDSI